MIGISLLVLIFLLGIFLNFFRYKLLPSVYLIVCIFLTVVYVCIPILMVVEPSFVKATIDFLSLSKEYIHFGFVYWSTVIIFFVFFSLTYFIVKSHLKNFSLYLPQRTIVFNSVSISNVLLFGFIFGCLGVWGLINYVNQYGGFTEAIMVANLVRAGVGEEYQIGNNVFSYRFADMAFIMVAVAIMVEKKRQKYLFIILSLPFFFYVIFLAKGKANLIGLVLVPIFYFFLIKKQSYPMASIFLMLGFLISLPFLEVILSTNSNFDEIDYSRIVLLFGYESIGVNAAIQKVTGIESFFMLNDFFYGLGGTFLPKSIAYQLTPYSTIEWNTLYLTGVFERTVPPGPIAFGYYSFGILGVVLFSIMLGLFTALLDKVFDVIGPLNHSVFIFLYSCVIFIMTNIVYHGVPEFIFYNHRLVIILLFS